jgi:hypothetical protein
MKKLTWTETFTTTVECSAEISEDLAQLFNDDFDAFLESGDYTANRKVIKERTWDEEDSNFILE